MHVFFVCALVYLLVPLCLFLLSQFSIFFLYFSYFLYFFPFSFPQLDRNFRSNRRGTGMRDLGFKLVFHLLFHFHTVTAATPFFPLLPDRSLSFLGPRSFSLAHRRSRLPQALILLVFLSSSRYSSLSLNFLSQSRSWVTSSQIPSSLASFSSIPSLLKLFLVFS